MISHRRVSTVLFFCGIAWFPTSGPSIAEAQMHAPAFHSVPFHPPVIHTPPIHITPLHAEPIHVAPIHSEPVHMAPMHSEALSHMTTPHLPSAPHANAASSFHAAPSARSSSSVGMGSFSHHGSGGGGRSGGLGGDGGGGSGSGRGSSLTQTFNNKATARSLDHSNSIPTNFRAKTPSSVQGTSGTMASKGPSGSRTVLSPHPEAVGPHSVFKRDTYKAVTRYETHSKNSNPRNPQPWIRNKAVDVKGGSSYKDGSHYNKTTKKQVPTPHVHEESAPGGLRPARADELPGKKKDG